MRSKPIGTGPFKVVEFKRNEAIKLVQNPDYWKKGRPYLDAIDWTHRAQPQHAHAGLRRGRVRHDVRLRRHLPDAEGRQGAEARRRLRGAADQRPAPTSWSTATSRRSTSPQLRRALVAGARPQGVQRHPVRGPRPMGAAMLPPPAGFWGMPKEFLETLPGFGPTSRRTAPRRARSWRSSATPGQAAQDQGRDAQHRDLSRPGGDPDRPAQADLYRGRARPDRHHGLVHQDPAQGLLGRHEPDRRRHRRSRHRFYENFPRRRTATTRATRTPRSTR